MSMKAASTEAPLTPSRMAWWILAMSAVRPSCQALDDVHLPQRPVGVELAAHHRGHEGVELGLPARRGQAGPGEVVVQLEVGVVHPDRVVRPKGTRMARWRICSTRCSRCSITLRICV